MERPAPKTFDLIAPIAGIAALLISMWPSVSGILSRWTKIDESYSHGYLLLALSLWLCYQSWQKVQPRASLHTMWLLPFIVGLGLYATGDLLLIQALRELMVVPLIMLALLVLWGWRQMLPFLIPIGIVFLAIPVWDYGAYTLQEITVVVNDVLLGLLGIQFHIEGVYVYLTGIGAFEVAHGCSGLRYLLVSIVLTSVYGHLNYRLWKTRSLLIALGIGFALITNWVRVFVIIYVGYATNMKSSLIENHEFFGWILFAVTLVPLMLIARRLETTKQEKLAESDADELPSKQNRTRRPAIGLAAVVLLSIAITGAAALNSQNTDSAVTASIDYSPLSTPWVRVFQKNKLHWMPLMNGADVQHQDVYFRPESDAKETADSFAAVGIYTYLNQRPGKKLVQWNNKIYDPEEWAVKKTFELKTNLGSPMSGLVLRGQRIDSELYVAYAYYVEGTWVDSSVEAKLAPLLGAFNTRHDGTLIAVGLKCGASCNAEEELQTLASKVEENVRKSLDQRFGTLNVDDSQQ